MPDAKPRAERAGVAACAAAWTPCKEALQAAGVRSVADLGCGDGALVQSAKAALPAARRTGSHTGENGGA